MKQLLFASVLSFLLIYNVPLASATLQNTCRKSTLSNKDYEFCMKTLQVFPKIETANTEEIAIIALNLTIANCTLTTSKINDMLKNDSSPSSVKESLLFCKDKYNLLLTNLNTTMDLLKVHMYDVVLPGMIVVVHNPDECEKAFGTHGIKSLLHEENHIQHELTTLTLNIISAIDDD